MSQYVYHNAGNSEAQEMGALSRLFAQSGVLAATGVLDGLVVTQASTANGTVLIAAGSAVVQPSMTAGASLLVNDSSGAVLDIFTANPMGGLPRNDIVVFDSITNLVIAIIGVPNATPTDPTVPNTAVALARLRNIASAVAIDTAHIDNLIVATTLRGAGGANMGTPTTTGTSGTFTSAGTETRDAVLGNYTFTALAGRRYRAVVDQLIVAPGTVGDLIGVRIRNGGASTPTAASTLVASTQTVMTTLGIGVAVAGTFVPGAGTVTLSLFLIRASGSGTSQPQNNRELYAVDLGPA